MLEVSDLNVFINNFHAVSSLFLSLKEGEAVIIAGESGAGKSLSALSMLHLLDEKKAKISGKVLYNGKDILALSEKELSEIRGKEISIAFQDPFMILKPSEKISKILTKAIRLHNKISRKEAKEIAKERLKEFFPSDYLRVFNSYPRELSSGMRARAMLAATLINNPKVLIADEITRSLDTINKEMVIEALKKKKEDNKTSLILIMHDLSNALSIADYVYIMNSSLVLEKGSADDVLLRPMHPYTKHLLNDSRKDDGIMRKSDSSCPFYSRCNERKDLCKNNDIPFIFTNNRYVRCLLYDERYNQSR